jgi:hypothetical protein
MNMNSTKGKNHKDKVSSAEEIQLEVEELEEAIAPSVNGGGSGRR